MAKKMRTEPMNIKFDSHSVIKRLIKKGLKEPIAEELVGFVEERQKFDTSNLATKADIALVKQEMSYMKETMATKADLEKTKNEILKWQIATIITLASVIIACFKFFPH